MGHTGGDVICSCSKHIATKARTIGDRRMESRVCWLPLINGIAFGRHGIEHSKKKEVLNSIGRIARGATVQFLVAWTKHDEKKSSVVSSALSRRRNTNY